MVKCVHGIVLLNTFVSWQRSKKIPEYNIEKLSEAKETSLVRRPCESMMGEESNHNKQIPLMI